MLSTHIYKSNTQLALLPKKELFFFPLWNKIVLILSLVLFFVSPLRAEDLNISGVWLIETPMPTIHTVNGSLPPLKLESKAIYEQHLVSRTEGDIYFDRTTWCASPGMPRFMLMPYTFNIIVGESQVAFLYEWYDWYRVVNMEEPETEVVYPISMGFANGHWEGKTFVIETKGIMEETILDSAGLPHSEDMVLTERIRLLDNDLLENVMTVSDSAHYTEPWEFKVSYRRQPFAPLAEVMCVDSLSRGEPAIRNN